VKLGVQGRLLGGSALYIESEWEPGKSGKGISGRGSSPCKGLEAGKRIRSENCEEEIPGAWPSLRSPP